MAATNLSREVFKMLKKSWLGLALIVVVAVAVQLVAQPPAGPGPDPAVKWQKGTRLACQQYRTELDLAWQSFLLQTEAALEEERINLDHALHERAVTVWLAAETYAESPRDPGSRSAYVQAASMAQGALAQALGQHHGAAAQALGQQLGTLQQTRSSALQTAQQNLAQSFQSFTQAMPQFEGEPEPLDLAGWLMEPTDEERQPRAEAGKALTEALEQARTAYREALAQATAAWRQTIAQETARWRNGTADQDEVRAALHKANRRWLTTGMEALEELRAAFRTAQRKYQLALEE